MKRVVITGFGIVSCLGNDKQAVTESLREGRSGIKFQETYKEMGMRSHVAGSVDIDLDAHIDRKIKRFMGDAAAYAYIAMKQAIEDAGLTEAQISNPRTGLIVGSGGGSPENLACAKKAYAVLALIWYLAPCRVRFLPAWPPHLK